MKGERSGKCVLVVAGEFPPIKTIGRIRTAKFVQHLRNEGWFPIVLTIKTTSKNYDSSLEGEVLPDVPIYRVEKIDLESMVVDRIKSMQKKNGGDSYSELVGKVGGGTEEGQSVVGFFNRIKELLIPFFKGVLKYIVYIPDDYNLWAYQSTKIADEIFKEYNIQLVYTSLPPFSACYIGYRVKHKHNVPWVVDYRDLWFGDVLREWIPGWRQKLELLIERHYIQQADAIISVSKQKTEFLKNLLNKSHAKWYTITNGYDSEVFEPMLSLPRKINEYFDFVYTGRLFKNRRGYAFAEALGQLCQNQPELKGRVRVHILGGVSPEIQAKYDEILAAYGIESLFNFTGDISYQKAMESQINADYLLLIVDTGATSDGVIPGKLFEYIASRRPIFALTDPGATQEIIEKAGAGVVVPAESVEECKVRLQDVLNRNIPDEVFLNSEYLKQFDRKELSKRLAQVFDDLIVK